MKELLEQLQKLSAPPMMNGGYVCGYADGVHDAIDLITEHMEGKVIAVKLSSGVLSAISEEDGDE